MLPISSPPVSYTHLDVYKRQEYMASHDISISAEDSFTSLDAVANFMLAEYQREFYAEGVMFYQYKRRNSTSMTFLFGETMNEGRCV